MSAYHRRLTGDDAAVRLKCAQRWSGWEMATSRLFVDPELIKRAEADEWAIQFARIESLVVVLDRSCGPGCVCSLASQFYRSLL